MRMCDREKYKPIVKLIHEHYRVVDRHLVENAKGIILVFKPAWRRAERSGRVSRPQGYRQHILIEE